MRINKEILIGQMHLLHTQSVTQVLMERFHGLIENTPIHNIPKPNRWESFVGVPIHLIGEDEPIELSEKLKKTGFLFTFYIPTDWYIEYIDEVSYEGDSVTSGPIIVPDSDSYTEVIFLATTFTKAVDVINKIRKEYYDEWKLKRRYNG